MNTVIRMRALILSLAVVGVASAARAEIALPKISAPLPSTADSYPFGGAEHTRVPTDLKAIGYVEEEVFASGAATVYDWPKDINPQKF